MQELNDERVLFAFARDLEPALTVASGETVRIRTQDCFGNQVQTPEDELDEIDWDRINPATGPVFVEGALFGCGDMHAAMGDGEISVSGAEVAGYATVTLTALPDLHLVDPLIENGTHLGIIASAESLDAAADRAVHEMVDLLHDRTGVDEAELVMLLSLVADVQVCQMVDPQKTVRFMVPKYVLESLGFKL